MNLSITSQTSYRHKDMLARAKMLGLDLAQAIGALKKEKSWDAVRGTLRKSPSGLQHQRSIRKEWL